MADKAHTIPQTPPAPTKNDWRTTYVNLVEIVVPLVGAVIGLSTYVAVNAGFKSTVYALGGAGLFAAFVLFFGKYWQKMRFGREVAFWTSAALLVPTLYFGLMSYYNWGFLPPHIPTLLSLWGSEYAKKGSPNEMGHIDHRFGRDHWHGFYKVVRDESDKTTFLTLYFPESPVSVEAAKEIAGTDWGYFGFDASAGPHVNFAGTLITDGQFRFTGEIKIYAEVFLTPDEQNKIRAAFGGVGGEVTFLDEDYAIKEGNRMINGEIKQTPDYEQRNHAACRITPRKEPPAFFRNGFFIPAAEGDDFTDLAPPGKDPCKAFEIRSWLDLLKSPKS